MLDFREATQCFSIPGFRMPRQLCGSRGGGEGGAHVTGAPGTGQEAEVEVGGLGNNHRFGA